MRQVCGAHLRAVLHPFRGGSNEGKTSLGYTIVEVMIFLAVSGGMIVTANALLSGQQGRTEFVQSIRDFDSVLQDISNDVSTGFAGYNFDAGNTCRFTPAGDLVVNAGPPEGSPQRRCIFIGKTVQFTPDGYRIYPVVGHQASLSNQDVVSLAEAQPHALVPGNAPDNNVPDLSTSAVLRSGTIEKVTYSDGTDHQTWAFGFFADFKGSAVNAVQSTGSGVNVSVYNPARIDRTTSVANVADAIKDLGSYANTNPSGGITLCIKSQSSKQIAYISIGSGASAGIGGGRLTITSRIQDGGSCS